MKRWLAVCAGVLALMMPVGSVFAATPSPSPAATPGQGLEISPPVLELSANPGQTTTATIRVRNVSSGPLVITSRADDFGASGEDGKPKLLLDETSATRYSLKFWVAAIAPTTIAPQELKSVSFKINIPANAEPGGHFGVLRFTGAPPNLSGTGVSLSASVGTLVLLRVSGAITDSLKVQSFTAAQNGKVHSFFEHGPVDFSMVFKNDGSVHEKPEGVINVTDMFGHKVGSVAINPNGGNVLPGPIPRRFDGSLGNKSLFGRYTATFTGAYLDDNHRLVSKITFWVIPWKLLLLALVGLIVLIWLLRLAMKRYNAYIIRQARRN